MNVKQPIRELVTISHRMVEVEQQYDQSRDQYDKARTKWEESHKKHEGWKRQMDEAHQPLSRALNELISLRQQRDAILGAVNPILDQIDAALDLASAVRRLKA